MSQTAESQRAASIRKRYGMKDDLVGMQQFIDDPEFLPYEVEEEALAFGMDPEDPDQRQELINLVIMDPDIFGDWMRDQ